jgi:hypothetical protein
MLHDGVHVVRSEHSRGVYLEAKWELPLNTALIRVPASSAITPHAAVSMLSPWLASVSLGLSPHAAIALCLLRHSDMEADQAHVDVSWARESCATTDLPMPSVIAPHEADLRQLFDDANSPTVECRKAACPCIRLCETAAKRTTAIRRDYTSLEAAWRSRGEPNPPFSFQAFARCVMFVHSRGLRYPTSSIAAGTRDALSKLRRKVATSPHPKALWLDADSVPALVPIIELLNHNPHSGLNPGVASNGNIIVAADTCWTGGAAADLHRQHGGGAAQGPALLAGDEICIDYGAYGDEQFLTDYGFVPHRNQSAVASLTIDANDADRFERACTSLGLPAGSVSVPLDIVVHQKYRRDADANYAASAEDRDNALDLKPLEATHLVAACAAGVATNSEWLKHLEAAPIPLPDADEDQGMFTSEQHGCQRPRGTQPARCSAAV